MRLSLDAKNKILGDRYYLHYLVAQSNYSKIFLATDLAINDRKCAIKQLSPNYCPVDLKPKVESAFLNEAQVLKQFAGKHPQICQYYSYLIDSGNQYIVQEWIEGTTLEQRLQQSPKLSVAEIKLIVLNVLSILEHVHNQGIVHNDIKPGNIVLRLQNNLPVLIDFGVAKQINRDYGQSVVGTPGYMSIEQAMGKAIFSNDLYSLGLTAIHLLTGKSPQGTDFNLPNTDNFWLRAKSAFDRKLVEVIDRAISVRENERFASARDMFDTLKSKDIVLMEKANSDRPKAKLSDALLTLVLAMLGMGFYLNYLTSQSNAEFAQKSANSGETENAIVEVAKDKAILQEDALQPIPPVQATATEHLDDSSSDREFQTQPAAIKGINNALKETIFVPGTDGDTVLKNLGEPLWRKPGFWANSIAWSYEDIVSPGFDIGYMFDTQTNKLRQAEIAVPPTTELSTIQSAMNSFLAAEQSTVAIEQGLQEVYQRQKNSHNFRVGNLKGVVQRNHKDRIYLAVWEADFH